MHRCNEYMDVLLPRLIVLKLMAWVLLVGVSGLWKGWTPAVLRAIPMNATVFLTLECSNVVIEKFTSN